MTCSDVFTCGSRSTCCSFWLNLLQEKSKKVMGMPQRPEIWWVGQMSFHHQLNLPHFTQRSVLFNSMSRTSSRMRSPTSKNYFYFARCPSEFGHYPVLRRMAGTRYFWHEMGYNTRLRLRRISLVFNPISQEKYDGDGNSLAKRKPMMRLDLTSEAVRRPKQP